MCITIAVDQQKQQEGFQLQSLFHLIPDIIVLLCDCGGSTPASSRWCLGSGIVPILDQQVIKFLEKPGIEFLQASPVDYLYLPHLVFQVRFAILAQDMRARASQNQVDCCVIAVVVHQHQEMVLRQQYSAYTRPVGDKIPGKAGDRIPLGFSSGLLIPSPLGIPSSVCNFGSRHERQGVPKLGAFFCHSFYQPRSGMVIRRVEWGDLGVGTFRSCCTPFRSFLEDSVGDFQPQDFNIFKPNFQTFSKLSDYSDIFRRELLKSSKNF